MRRLLPFLFVLLFVPAMSGCRGAGFFAAGIVTGAIIASHPHHREVIVYEPEVVYVPAPTVYVPPPAPPARETPPPPRGPAFDQGAARASLGAVDLSECKGRGAPAGYGHARVTFVPGGNVEKVVVDGPSGLSPDAVSCIGQALGTAEVPPFDGAAVAVPTTWLVK